MPSSFAHLAGCATAGLHLFWLAMPETRMPDGETKEMGYTSESDYAKPAAFKPADG